MTQTDGFSNRITYFVFAVSHGRCHLIKSRETAAVASVLLSAALHAMLCMRLSSNATDGSLLDECPISCPTLVSRSIVAVAVMIKQHALHCHAKNRPCLKCVQDKTTHAIQHIHGFTIALPFMLPEE
jgi:hypothetical protein